MDKHVSNVCSTGFIVPATATCPAITGFRVSGDAGDVHTVVSSRIDYCWRAHFDTLQRLLNAAARHVSDTRNFDRGLRQLVHVDLHWLDVPVSTPERVKFKLVSMVHNCLHHKAPRYLTDYCIRISGVASRRHLRSARRHYLVVPRHSLSSYGRLLPV